MSVAELKVHLIYQITTLQDEALLKDVMKLIEGSEEESKGALNLSATYNQIKEQYGEVLQKLAQ